jgi:predicted Zn-dependent protease
MENIETYIKDSLINGKICRFNKKEVKIYLQKISAYFSENQKQEYYSIVEHGVNIWNKFAPVHFDFVDIPSIADIVVIWTKTGIKFEGMCKYRSIVASEIKAITIELGLPNPNSPKIITKESILHTILHELGHAMGLGHGINENDIMYVPHKKTLNIPSKNDIYVLKILYHNQIGTDFQNLNF